MFLNYNALSNNRERLMLVVRSGGIRVSLRSLGFDVNNTTFEKNSWYFRNALVRANYQNLQKGIYKETIHLERFFRNLLMGEENVLMNRHLHIKAKELLDGATQQVPQQVSFQRTKMLNV